MVTMFLQYEDDLPAAEVLGPVCVWMAKPEHHAKLAHRHLPSVHNQSHYCN